MIRDNSYLLGNKFAAGNKPNQTSFKKGCVPWNFKTRGICKSNKESFVKGNRPLNWKPVGEIRVRLDKSGARRYWIKIKEPNVWQERAKFIWLKNGNILESGMCLHHINNNSSDDRIENLILVSRSTHPKLHNRWNTQNFKKRRLIIEMENERRIEIECGTLI